MGEEKARLLADRVTDGKTMRAPSDLLGILGRLSLDDLMRIPDVGPKVAESIYNWFREERNVKFLKKLTDVGVEVKRYAGRPRGQKLKGKSFVLTGSMESMSREEAKNKIRELGGDPSESVSKRTDYVVVGSEPGSKFEKAKKLGVKTISEKEFLKIIG